MVDVGLVVGAAVSPNELSLLEHVTGHEIEKTKEGEERDEERGQNKVRDLVVTPPAASEPHSPRGGARGSGWRGGSQCRFCPHSDAAGSRSVGRCRWSGIYLNQARRRRR